ncbi:hypothetical protein M8C21_028833 [Ambrosia artemisiifolia]|uniref:Protein LONGIFOLIA 1-like protein n=1 Tax=Ambrosia artemisiifolia TaxID=4212 RepID=A0AAD5BPH7_AMBAR|nr:hypothetical protein M8C21_028833 [Ambrosia artemisiifolia]
MQDQIEKQIGCMSGFLHIFDRQHIFAEKRIHSAKCLSTSAGVAVFPDSVKSVNSVKSTAIREIEKPKLVETVVSSSTSESGGGFSQSPTANLKFFPTSTPPRSPLPLPLFEVKNSWKFYKEMPRLSLDSRAIVDSKGSLCPKEIRPDSLNGSVDNHGRSPSVIAKLMGLEQLPSSVSSPSPEHVTKPELRRSASESRVSTNLFHSGFIKGNNLQTKRQIQSHKQSSATTDVSNISEIKYSSRSQNNKPSPLRRYPIPSQRRNFFDSSDIFPEPKHKRMLLSGKNYEQSKDLEALKNILEALQLKGLLHSINKDSHHNFVYDHSNIVHMNRHHSCSSNRRYSNDISPKTDRGVFDRGSRSPVRARKSAVRSKTELNPKNRNANDKRNPLCVETQKRVRECSDSRRNSPISSPKLTPKRNGHEHGSVVSSRSPRSRRPSDKSCLKQKVCRTVVVEDESSSVSESSGSTTSQFDVERSKMEEYGQGKSLLERCDKLLAEMNNIAESHTSSNSVLPSPVSVLNSSFDKDESLSPSPVKKRTIDFKDLTNDPDDDLWSTIISPATPTEVEGFISDDSDFKYISQILQASKHLPIDSTAFFFIEKQQYPIENNPSNGSKLQRKLVFDIVTEILNRNKDLPPWNTTSLTKSSSCVKNICSEFQKIRETQTAENVLDLICFMLKKDLAEDNRWGDHPLEKSEAVLYIERLIFKDLVSEMIRNLAEFAGKPTFLAPRRKLVF